MITTDKKALIPGKYYYGSFVEGWLYGRLISCSNNSCVLKVSHLVDPTGRAYRDNPSHNMTFPLSNIYANRKRPYPLRRKRI